MGHSVIIESKKPRGGVAVYKNLKLETEIDVLSLIFKDTVVLKIRNTDAVIAAMNIPPGNSEYYNSSYFRNCELIITHFGNITIVLTSEIVN